jgi:hypothetical protein
VITQNSEKESVKQQPVDLEVDESNHAQEGASIKPTSSSIHVEARPKSEMSMLLESLAGQCQGLGHSSTLVAAPELKPISFAPSIYQ